MMTTYLRAGNEERLYSEHTDLLDEANFDFETAGARILGRDLGVIAGKEVRARLVQILESGVESSQDELVLRALPLRSALARQLLQSLRKGLQEFAAS
jgi:predicted nucleotidyltransferase